MKKKEKPKEIIAEWIPSVQSKYTCPYCGARPIDALTYNTIHFKCFCCDKELIVKGWKK
jgi:hypothetical protein